MDPTLHFCLEQAEKNIYPFIFSSKDITKKEDSCSCSLIHEVGFVEVVGLRTVER